MSRHRNMRAMLNDIDDAYDDYDQEEGSDYEDGNVDSSYLYNRKESGAEIPLGLGPLPPPSPSLTTSISVSTGLSKLGKNISVGSRVTAQYTADGQWYPAVVTALIPLGDGHNLYRVIYEGYGNEEDLTLEQIRLKKDVNTEEEKYVNNASNSKPKSKKGKKTVKINTKASVTKSRSVPYQLGTPKDRKQTEGKKDKKQKETKKPKISRQPSEKQERRRREFVEARVGDTSTKSKISLVVVGHVDAGKSTLMGHMLYLLGKVNERTMRKYEKEATHIGKKSFKYAWVLDGHEEERKLGITVDVGVSHFLTSERSVTLLDTPGHKDFVPNMISGASRADAAILVVPAKTGEFEASFKRGGQTKEHATLVRSLGVKNIIIAVNKMDLVDWDSKRFHVIRQNVTSYLRGLGYKSKQIQAVPVSGLGGENLIDCKVNKLKTWYTGPTLSAAIDMIPPKALEGRDAPFSMVVTDVYKGIGGTTVAGKILTGAVIPKDRVLVLPLNEVITVKSITSQEEVLKVGIMGDSVELIVKDFEDAKLLTVGQLLCTPHLPLPFTKEFTAKLLTLTPKIPLLTGQNIVVYALGTGTTGYIKELSAEIDKKTGQAIKRRPRCIPQNSAGEVVICLSQPVCLENFKKQPTIGRVSIRRGAETVAFGIVTETIRTVLKM
eukprot:CAMPEP_0167740036 /NCGR_PEP_ID=MMETSP0110_2-20121227/53_1 /TAXON_ID=629695 /ORGANISM="Gymnochlora sp., Strain CCMP2014" /LENGTH=663 /DNA_ID=CAMNT_0007623883 /DNA_START=95 /DNA_END=2083 /DNA_ORIENTATION=-